MTMQNIKNVTRPLTAILTAFVVSCLIIGETVAAGFIAIPLVGGVAPLFALASWIEAGH